MSDVYPLWTEEHVRNCLGSEVDYDKAFNLAMRIIGYYEARHLIEAIMWESLRKRLSESEAQVSDLRAALRVAQGQLVDVEEIRQRMELWTGTL